MSHMSTRKSLIMRKMPKTKRIIVKSVLRREVESLTPMNPMIRRLDNLLNPQLLRRRSTVQFLPEASETDSPLITLIYT